ncbi:unnamed protein product [Meloidogyne enterolobii]|uniref:Uncharacterized protein n=1 Tax=Meloidogyne enterolobii TaxID=390850 RepID=A0ACB1A1M3_MELEN
MSRPELLPPVHYTTADLLSGKAAFQIFQNFRFGAKSQNLLIKIFTLDTPRKKSWLRVCFIKNLKRQPRKRFLHSSLKSCLDISKISIIQISLLSFPFISKTLSII